ncbi:hypothetical protein HanIR_Chr15g0743501 [Helianthus annuus]|nr:hypothetical protein HanIR_Chr15g0743501 [Helianthus annuus]
MMASSSSSPPADDNVKGELIRQVLLQYNRDVLCSDVLKQSYTKCIDKKDKVTMKLMSLPASAIRDLVMVFTLDEKKKDLEKFEKIAVILDYLKCSIELKLQILESY